MSPRLRALSGPDVVSILGRFGFVVVATRGSHARLARSAAGSKQILTVPLHRPLAPGTLHAIYRQALRCIADAELRPFFFSEGR